MAFLVLGWLSGPPNRPSGALVCTAGVADRRPSRRQPAESRPIAMLVIRAAFGDQIRQSDQTYVRQSVSGVRSTGSPPSPAVDLRPGEGGDPVDRPEAG